MFVLSKVQILVIKWSYLTQKNLSFYSEKNLKFVLKNSAEFVFNTEITTFYDDNHIVYRTKL